MAGLVLFAAAAALLWRGRGDVLVGLPAPALEVPFEISSPGSLASDGRYGVNADLAALEDPARAADRMRESGLVYVRQPFRWAEMEPRRGEFDWGAADSAVEAADSAGLEIIALLDTTPGWARPPDTDEKTPPTEISDFGAFARALAERYGDSVRYYQVWHEPNLGANWGGGFANPSEYAAMLREAAINVRAVDPDAVMVLAALAPTTESGPLNLNEPAFLAELYRLNAPGWFDAAAVQLYGFWTDADDRVADVSTLNFSRGELLRRVMVANGDSRKPVIATAFGWNALPEGWEGQPSPWGTDSEEKQAARTLEAMRRARAEWPWLGPVLFAAWQPVEAGPDSPKWGFAMLAPDGTPRLLHGALAPVLDAPPAATVGSYPPDHPTGTYDGGWRVTSFAADVPRHGSASLTIPFEGTRLDLYVRRGVFKAFLYVSVDGAPANALPLAEDGRAYVVLYDPLMQTEPVTLARGLADGPHVAVIEADRGWYQWAIVGWRVARERDVRLYDAGIALCGVLALAALGMLAWSAYYLPLGRWWGMLRAWHGSRPEWAQLAAFALIAAGFFFAPGTLLSLLPLALLFVNVLLRPDFGLMLVAFGIPYFLAVKPLAGRVFSMVEIGVLMSAASVLLARLYFEDGRPYRPRLYIDGVRLTSLDWSVVFLVALSLAATFAAGNFGVSMREFRVVVLESALFYFAIRFVRVRDSGAFSRRLVDAFLLGATLLSVYTLYQYFFTTDVITAEGVRRARAIYGSPNNLGLLLDRVVPMLVALAAWGRARERRIAYALALPVNALALYLTFSKGALLFGLPSAILFIGVVGGGAGLWASLGVLAVTALGLVPLLGTERFQSTFDTSRGTTTFFRLKLWESAAVMIKEHPWLGVGLDNFLYLYRTRYILPHAWQEPNLSHPHNLILDFGTRLGVGGIFAIAWLQVGFWKEALGLYRRLRPGDARALVLGLMGSMVAFLAHGFVDNSYFLVDMAFIFFLAVGVVSRLGGESLEE